MKLGKEYSTMGENGITKTLSASTCLKPILSVEDKLLAPILYTIGIGGISYHIQRCEMILSKISDDSKVKQFLINEFDKPIKVCATESTYTKNILKHVTQIENYDIKTEKIHSRDSKGQIYSHNVTTSYNINDITRNEYSYNNSSFLDFYHILLKSNLYINKLGNEIYKDKATNCLPEITYNSSLKDILSKNMVKT